MKNRRKLILLSVILGALLLFIWGNSMLPVNQSKAESRVFSDFLNPILERFLPKDLVEGHDLVRKLAHFSEFAALGFVLGLILQVTQREKPFYFSYVILCGVFVAVIDETIQLFSYGRGSQVKDVLIDSAGALTGLLFARLVAFLCKKLRNRRE